MLYNWKCTCLRLFHCVYIIHVVIFNKVVPHVVGESRALNRVQWKLVSITYKECHIAIHVLFVSKYKKGDDKLPPSERAENPKRDTNIHRSRLNVSVF